MAEMTFAIKDEGSAKAWVAKANALAEELNTLNEKVARVIEYLEKSSEGDIVANLVIAANAAIKAANQIMTVFKDICKGLNDAIDKLVEGVGSLVSKLGSIFGIGD